MYTIDAWVIIVIAILVIGFLALVIYWSIKAHQKKVSAGREELIGRTAVVETALAPRGIVLVEGERWTAVTEGDRAEPEEEVIITKVEGLKLKVTNKKK